LETPARGLIHPRRKRARLSESASKKVKGKSQGKAFGFEFKDLILNRALRRGRTFPFAFIISSQFSSHKTLA
jgi:hypothetical protein